MELTMIKVKELKKVEYSTYGLAGKYFQRSNAKKLALKAKLRVITSGVFTLLFLVALSFQSSFALCWLSYFPNTNLPNQHTIISHTDFISPLQQPCVGQGNKCTVITEVLILNPLQVPFKPLSNNMVELSIPIEQIKKDCQPNPELGYPFSLNVDIKYYTFEDGTKFIIKNFDEYPSLNGRVLDVSGLTTDLNGILHYIVIF